jgi:hypothetical protein
MTVIRLLKNAGKMPALPVAKLRVCGRTGRRRGKPLPYEEESVRGAAVEWAILR